MLKYVAKEVCIRFKIEGGVKSVCDGMIDLMAGSLLPVVGNGLLSSDRICDELLQVCTTPNIKELSADDFVKSQIH